MSDFPIQFNFKAFESISATISAVQAKFGTLKESITGFNNRFEIAHKKSEGFREGLEKFGDKVGGVGEKLSLFVTTPLAALGAKMTHTSMEAQEAASKFEQVFKGVSEGARNASVDQLKTGFDVSTQSAHELLSTNGLLLKDLGFTGGAALKMSEQMAEVAIQTAAFRNVEGGSDAVMQTFRQALLGQTKGLKAMGITMEEADVRAQALAMAQSGQRFESIEQAKALATFALIQQKTKDDQEDFVNSSKELANQTRVSKERFKELSKVIGDILKPAAERNLRIFNGLMLAFMNLSPHTQKLIVTMATIAAITGPVLVVIGKLATTVIPALITGVEVLTAAFAFLSWPVIGIIAAIAALAVAGYFIIKNWEAVKEFMSALWDGPLVRVLRFITGIDGFIAMAKLIIDNWTPIKAFFGGLFDWIGNKVKWLWENSGLQLLLDGAARLGKLALFGSGGKFGADAGAPAQGAGAGGIGAQASGMQSEAQAIGQGIVKELRSTNDAKVQVDFSNMPRGTQVSSQSTSIPPFLSLGMMGAPL